MANNFHPLAPTVNHASNFLLLLLVVVCHCSIGQFWWRMHMAPPDKDKAGKATTSDGDSDGRRSHPCDGSGGSPSAVDQDHKACDEYPQGEAVSPLL